MSCMETPYSPQVENSLQTYKRFFNDPDKERAKKDDREKIVSLSQLVDNSNKERQKIEYMVCITLTITSLGMAQTMGGIGGQQGGTQQSMPYQ
jgi:hypothetical protein